MGRMITMEVYSVKELSGEAREYAFNKFCENDNYSCDGNEQTLDEFLNIFPIRVKEWQYGGGRNYINFEFNCDYMDEAVEGLSGQRLATYLWNNYKMDLFKGKYYSKSRCVNGKYKIKSRNSKIIMDNSCVLTGYYIDEAILGPIYKFLQKPYDITFYDLIDLCLNAWINACSRDYEDYYSMEYFIQDSLDNECEYYKDGRGVTVKENL